MSSDTELTELKRTVRYLKDRQDILDCINRHARGHDRHDVEIIESAYHSDGVDEHGPDINPASRYAAWANGVHANSLVNMHNITTHTCEIEGDAAYAESYCLVGLLAANQMVTLLNGRYIDQLERRDGAWRILKRRTTLDFACVADATLLTKAPQMKGYVKGARDQSDISYPRPVEIGADAPRW
jgi:hypothetical protein